MFNIFKKDPIDPNAEQFVQKVIMTNTLSLVQGHIIKTKTKFGVNIPTVNGLKAFNCKVVDFRTPTQEEYFISRCNKIAKGWRELEDVWGNRRFIIEQA